MSAQKWFIAGLAIVCSIGVRAETVTNNLDVQGGFIYNHGAVNPGDIGMTFTNAGIRDITISAGQLSGVDPETGAVITNSANLLPLKAQSLTTVSNVTAGGKFIGDGSGLTNLNVVAAFPTSGVWNAAGMTITNATLAGQVFVSSLNVDSISGNGAGLTNVVAKAGGSSGQVQYNSNGALAGYTNLFVHPVDGGLTVRERSGYFLRMYNSETLTDTNLIVSLRNESGTSFFRLRKNNQDTIRLSGDGTAYIKGNLQLDGQLIADGSRITNLPVQAQVNALVAAVSNSPASTITTNQIASWNSGGSLAGSVQLSTGNVSITTNLSVQGTISGDGSGLTKVAAGGSNGQVQYNSNGALAGYTNLFVHPADGGLAVRERSGYFLRMYNSETLTDTNLIVSLRNESGTSFFRLRQNNQDNIVLKGDGSALVKSLTVGGVTRTNWPSQMTETEIAAMGFAKTSAIPTETQVDVMVANNGYASAATLSTVATSGNYTDLIGRPVLAPIATNANFSNLTVADGAIALAKVNGLTNTYMTVAASTNYISTAQFSAGTSNLLNKTAASNVLTGALTLQTNLLAQGKVIVGSPAFAQQTVSNATTGALIVDGVIRGDGSGLTNLPVQAQVNALLAGISNSPAAAITTDQIATWGAAAALAEYMQVSAGAVTIDTNLTVQGIITGDGSGLTKVSAGGSNGQVQYNSNGTLAGYTNLFVHPVDGGLTVRERSGYFLRMYNSETLADTNLIVSLRNEAGTSMFRLRQNNQDNIVLKGDGSASVKSLTLGGVTHTEWPVVASGNFVDKDAATNVLTGSLVVEGVIRGNGSGLYIPQQGDLLMGNYTNGLPQ